MKLFTGSSVMLVWFHPSRHACLMVEIQHGLSSDRVDFSTLNVKLYFLLALYIQQSRHNIYSFVMLCQNETGTFRVPRCLGGK
jgi:hypothetical protein